MAHAVLLRGTGEADAIYGVVRVENETVNLDWPAGPLTNICGMIDLPLVIPQSHCGSGTSEAPVFLRSRQFLPRPARPVALPRQTSREVAPVLAILPTISRL